MTNDLNLELCDYLVLNVASSASHITNLLQLHTLRLQTASYKDISDHIELQVSLNNLFLISHPEKRLSFNGSQHKGHFHQIRHQIALGSSIHDLEPFEDLSTMSKLVNTKYTISAKKNLILSTVVTKGNTLTI